VRDKINYNKVYAFESSDVQKFRKDMHRSLDFRLDAFLHGCRIVEIPSDGNKIPWLKSEDVLILFYNLLRQYQYITINCTWEVFRFHFLGNEVVVDKIIFLQPINQLPYIFDCLEQLGFIAKCHQQHIRLAQHFDRSNNPISPKVLRSSLNKELGEKTKKFIDENIIQELIDHNG
jgi:hypothetical protein